jgi:anti-anti-sigma regulatory factor
METQNLSEDVILVELPFKEPQIADKLKAINEIVSSKPDFDVIIDFSKVEILTSSSIGNLIILRNFLHERGRRLILCNMASVTKCIFAVAGLKDIFVFVDDKSAALATVQHVS